MSRLVDFHCHLDLYPDHASAVRAAEAARIYTLTVTTTPKAWPRNRDLAKGTRYVRAALGLHPQLVAERASELTLWERYLPETPYVGEVGLDAGPRFYRSFEQQKQVFKRVLECCADAGGKVLTIHSVRATGAVLDLIQTHLPPDRARAVLHWFTGSKAEVRRAADLGCYFSVNAEMTRTERGRTIVAAMPADRILTETDGPFTRVGDRPAAPPDAIHAVAALSATRGLSEDASRSLVEDNFRALLASIRAETPVLTD